MSVYVPGDMKDIQGPCSTGWHLPLDMEISGLINLGISIGAWDATGAVDFATKLHIPFAGNREHDTSDVVYQGTRGLYWGCGAGGTDLKWGSGFWMVSGSGNLGKSVGYRSDGRTIRPFKNTYAKPTESWTVIEGTLGSAGIFWDTVGGMITITDGSMGYTIADKNLGATTVWNSGDTLSVNNCGKYYQRGNNYGFAFSVSVTKSSSRVDASTYGPGNYYSSSTFLGVGYSDWSSVQNNNLWGGDTGVRPVEITNAYIGIPNPESITLNKSSISLTTVGQTEQLTATLTPTVCDQRIIWTTTNHTVATVSTTGLVTCVTPGTCTITAITANGLTASCSVAQSRLPSAYQEVEWIQSSGSQYMNLGWYATSNYCKIEANITPYTGGQSWSVFWGMINGSNGYSLHTNQSIYYANLGSSTNTNLGVSFISGTNLDLDFTVDSGNYSLSLNGSTVTGTYSGSIVQSTRPFYLFAFDESGSATWKANIKLYSFKIYSDASTLARDLVPCYEIATTTIGLYDLVNDQFYTNAGSGTFTKGSDV